MDLITKISNNTKVLANVREEISKVIIGQEPMIEHILIGLLSKGHVLLEGVPGLAKTLTINTLSKVISLDFKRIQFTPDLLPSDLIGTMVFNQSTGEFTPKKGPIFTNIVLADEVNRAPAKVQSALLESMAEKQVTIGETSYKLNEPFLVMATQNPLEQEGTYPLPEAQLDRFMFKILVDYPTRKSELDILEKMSKETQIKVASIIDKDFLTDARNTIDEIHLDDKVKNYIVDIVMATRDPKSFGLSGLKAFIQVGASPRATINLAKASRANAYLNQREYVTADDVRKICYPVLRHRIIMTYEADAREYTTDQIIQDILQNISI